MSKRFHPGAIALAGLLLATGFGCTRIQGQPVDPDGLGYLACEAYHDCGPGRFCSAQNTCWSQCRSSADCAALASAGAETICNRLGECVEPGGQLACAAHADCGPHGLCVGACSASRALCGQAAECPLDGEKCAGRCAAWCGRDDDCLGFADQAEFPIECTPVGLCLPDGWERWIPPGELPPDHCTGDAQCKALGWSFECDCQQVDDPIRGRGCANQQTGTCQANPALLELGAGPADRPAHDLRGVWGARMNLAVVTYGLPLLSRQNTNSSHLLLIRARHTGGDRIELEEKLCSLRMVNFSDTSAPPSDLVHVTIPLGFLRAMPIVQHSLELSTTEPGDPFVTSQSFELRGCLLSDPPNDPLPSRHDVAADPADPRLWDQDRDGKPGLTTLTDGVLRGEIYIAQRMRLAFDGRILDPDRIAGHVLAHTEENILGSSKASLVYDISTEIHSDPDRTWFAMQRLALDASCADLIRMADRDGSFLAHRDRLGDPATD